MAKSIFKRNVNRSMGGTIFILLILIIFGAFMFLPMLFTIVSAFKPLDELQIFPPRFFVRNPTFENFLQLGQITTNFYVPLSRYIFNSFFISIIVTIGNLVLGSMAAYPLAKHNFPGKNLINKTIVLSLLFTAAVIMIPRFIIMAKVHIIDTYWSIILPALQSTLGLYLMEQFMVGIDDSMLEAARIDGAGEFRIYWSIMMPNVKPAWLTCIIFSFQDIWRNTGGTYIYNESLKVLPSILAQVQAGGLARAGVVYAASLVLMIPPVLIFLFSQNSIIETMSTSGLK